MWGTLTYLDLTLAVVFIVGVIVTLVRKSSSWLSLRSANLPLPPGPIPLPILGNVLEINSHAPWLTYTQWKEKYGGIVYLRLLNQEIIIINSEKIARALLDQRSRIYSDRPELVTYKLFGWETSSANLHYSDRWRSHRRMFHQAFRATAASSYRPLQLRKIHDLLLNLLDMPNDFESHLKTFSASVVMSITYGYETARRDDPLVKLVEHAIELANTSLTPEAAAFFNAFPAFLSLPSWFPGVGFKRTAAHVRGLVNKVKEGPIQFVKQGMASGTAIPSMVSNLLERIAERGGSQEQEEVLKEASATAFAAGSETTASLLHSFFLAMILYPRAQEQARSEIQAIVGKDRLPIFDDRPSLPYTEAVFRETLRWHPVTPLGIPHATTSSDIYEGYFIPKGVTIISNVWAMARDKEIYLDPAEFRPERFIAEDGKLIDDAADFIWGFGRRKCVGRHVAYASVWGSIVSILSSLKISKAKDDQGRDVEVDYGYTGGVTSHPEPFQCCIEPVSAEAERLIRLQTSTNDESP